MTVSSVAAAFTHAVAQWGGRPFLHILPETAAAYGITPGELSYREAGLMVDSLTGRYRGLSQQRVGLMLDNRPDFFLHWLALNACGASVVPLSAELRPPELDYLVDHSGLRLVVCAEQHLGVMTGAFKRAANPIEIRSINSSGGSPPHAGDIALASDAECALLYTSGTTGRPKGCVLTNDYFLRAGAWYAAAGGLAAIRPGVERLLTPLPMTHMNAMAYSTMAMIMSGGCIVPLERFHPRTWWSSVRQSEATVMHYLGVMPSMLLALPDDQQDRRHAVRFGFGAGVDRRHHAVFEERFGIPLLEAWAMTETGAGAVVIANQEPRHVGTACFGRPGPAVEVRVVDEAGAAVADQHPGEMLGRAAGPNPRAGFFREYLHDAAATADAWAGGWFHTGDVVRRLPSGELVFVDRRKNVIRRSGENISAVEVESVLRRHSAVRDVACAAVPDPLRGEEVLACVVPATPITASEGMAAAIVRAALEDLSYFKVPGYVAFVDALPLTATNKVQRGELKTLAAALVGTERCVDTRALKARVRQRA